MRIDDSSPDRLVLRDGDVALLDYVHAPTEAQVESPRPYALLRSRGGLDVTAHRPADHVWHKGLSLALPVVGPHNFWGGPTYVHPDGYVQLPNNGAQVHRGHEVLDDGDGVVRVVELLDWMAEDGSAVLAERRTLTARTIDDESWALTWHSALTNVSADELGFGSPTTKGRENAGYAGIFWRGPESFTGGGILTPDGPAGDAARGEPGPWLAFVAPDRSVGVLMLDGATQVNPWFARSEEYAGLNPAPFFFTEHVLAPGDVLVLSSVLVVGGADVARHASGQGAALVGELRATPSVPTAPRETA